MAMWTPGRKKIPFAKDVSIPGNIAFQIELMEILQEHKTDMKLYDEIIILLDQYLSTGKLNPKTSQSILKKSLHEEGWDWFQQNLFETITRASNIRRWY